MKGRREPSVERRCLGALGLESQRIEDRVDGLVDGVVFWRRRRL